MYQDFDKKIKKEIITLSYLKNIDNKSFGSYYDTWHMEYKKEKETPNKSKEEIKAEVKEEIKKNINTFEKESLEKYYKIKSSFLNRKKEFI